MPIHGDPQTWPPTPKKSTFRAALEQTYAHNGRVNNLRFFSLQEALQFLCSGKEQSRIAGRTRAPSELSNPRPLRAFFIGNWHAKRLICSIFFEYSIRVIYCIFLEPLRMNRPRTNAPEAIEPRVIPLPQ